MINKKKSIVGASSLLLLLLVFGLVSAGGVATPYWKDNPLKMYPGESTTVALILQNEGDANLVYEATVIADGQGIATFSEDLSYLVPAKAYDIRVPVKIDVPLDFAYGGEHTIEVQFRPVTTSDDGMIGFGTVFTTGFPVQVVTETESTFYKAPPKEKGMEPIWYIVIALLLLILILLAFILRKK